MISGVTGDLLSSAYLDSDDTAPVLKTPPREDAWLRSVARWWRRAGSALGPASAPRSVLDIGARPLLDLLELRLTHVERHPWGHAALVAHGLETVATLVCPAWGTSPAAAWRHALRSTLVTAVPWALVFTGTGVSVVDATRPWARRFLAFDLATTCGSPRAMLIMWRVLSGAALQGGTEGALARAIAASDAAGLAVCAALGDGVLDALGALVHEIGGASRRNSDGRAARSAFDQSLTIVYRLLFLLFAEARDLVPLWHRIYRDAYSVKTLCDRLLENPAARGTWSTVQAMARLAHAGCHADDLHVTAFNGRLFAPGRTPLGESGRVRDEAAGRAVLALGTTATHTGRRRVSFRDLGVEQLGAVYERVLDYEPVREHRTLALRRTSNERKTTGSFYTPRAMTDFLVRRTLGPLVEGRSSDAILSLRILDPAMGSGAFLVAACRFLAERVEQARITDGSWTDGDVTDAERIQVFRTVAERCLFGIDRNPTAVQLARLSLWLTTLAADRPLTFLDHHLATGNSLVGARLADLPRPPSTTDRAVARDQLSLFGDDARADWSRAVVPEWHRLARDPSDSAAEVRAKERRLDELLAAGARTGRWARAADLWCGLALQEERVSPGLYAEMQHYAAGQATTLAAAALRDRVERALGCARAYDAAHWELLFPEAFFDTDGARREDAGFDAVIGNPPWEMIRADTGRGEARTIARGETSAAMRFIRASGQYPLHGSGHVNEYQLFLERTLQALAPGGRFGLILPSGLQTDVGSGGLRRALLDRTKVDTWITFDNRRAIFPIHRSVRFLLLAGTAGGQTTAVRLTDGGSDPAGLSRLPDNPGAESSDAHVAVSRGFLERWDPVHLTVPWVTSRAAMEVAARALETPALGHAGGWGVTFGRELNASDNRADLVSGRPEGRGELLPVVEGKHLRPFGVDVSAAASFIEPSRAAALLGNRWQRPRVCYRDVASSTNRLTLMAAVLPGGVVSTHTVFCARTALAAADAWCLTGLLNSLVVNYLVRLQMTTHVTTALMARLPVPRPMPSAPAHDRLAAAARRLSMHESIEAAPEAYARLDALVAHLYGLTPSQYEHVVSTFPLLPEPLRVRCLERFVADPATWPTPPRR
jgi:hypothetical protein